MSAWTFDRHERLADARDHARAILTALQRRRADAVRFGDRLGVAVLDARIAATDRRYRCLARLARSEKRRAALV